MNSLANIILALALILFAAGCGDADPKSLISDGHASLGAGDANAALEHFQEALGKLGRNDADYLEAKLGEIEALIVLDAKQAKDEFLVLAKALPDQVGQAKYLDIGGKLANGKRFSEAIDLTHAGIERFGQDATKLRDRIDYIKKASIAANDDDALKKLDGLGYLK
jgi:hypothetical protein